MRNVSLAADFFVVYFYIKLTVYTHVYICFYYISVCNFEMSDVMFDTQFLCVNEFFSMHMYICCCIFRLCC